MKSTTLISLVVAILVGLWMGIGIMNAGAGLVFGVVTFVVMYCLLWFIGPLQPKDVPLRKKKLSVSIKGEDKASPGIDALAGSISAYDDESSTKPRMKPELTIPRGAGEKELKDLERHYGFAAKPGDTITLDEEGLTWIIKEKDKGSKTRNIGMGEGSPCAGADAEDYITIIPGAYKETKTVKTGDGEYTHTLKQVETDTTWLNEADWPLSRKVRHLHRYHDEYMSPLLDIPDDADDEELEKVMKLTGLRLHPGDRFTIDNDGSYRIVESADL